MIHPLTTLNRIPAEQIKEFVDDLLPTLEPYGVRVLENRTGLVMLPAQDPAQGATYFLGEVLVSEARVQLGSSVGYSACLGRDLEQAVAVALLDAAQREQVAFPQIQAFLEQHAQIQLEEDATLLRKVEATRVQMETF
jgi:alpha-D-ribose 1-methylphosphonate 5-triphosphate synthase subunit PhnG